MKWLMVLLSGVFLSFYSTGVFAQDEYNCDDFSTKEAVMEFWYENNYSAENDPNNLDGDGDGYPCEVTSEEFTNYAADRETAEENSDTTDDNGMIGEALPSTATNHVSSIFAAVGLVISGAFFFFRYRKVNE